MKMWTDKSWNDEGFQIRHETPYKYCLGRGLGEKGRQGKTPFSYVYLASKKAISPKIICQMKSSVKAASSCLELGVGGNGQHLWTALIFVPSTKCANKANTELQFQSKLQGLSTANDHQPLTSTSRSLSYFDTLIPPPPHHHLSTNYSAVDQSVKITNQ